MKKSLLLILVILMLFMVGCGEKEKEYTEISEEDYSYASNMKNFNNFKCKYTVTYKDDESKNLEEFYYYNDNKLKIEYSDGDVMYFEIEGDLATSYSKGKEDSTFTKGNLDNFDMFNIPDLDMLPYYIPRYQDIEFNKDEKCYYVGKTSPIFMEYYKTMKRQVECNWIYKMYICDNKISKIYCDFYGDGKFITILELEYGNVEKINIPE